eukprot:TRINITY_DN28501_c0_g1_i2.p1 TRINITY_DN28501_c0_g1~~TRINITY_DN28501_c0_g1_i2.p1  ORF type:complete len:250 (+),score=47.68 TRINITY_DN28501_c0_g1_i2:518-1267(+)
MLLFGVAIVVGYASPQAATATHPIKQLDLGGAPLFFAMAVYTFEGIGLALPIENEMARPEMFEKAWVITLSTITVLFLGFGSVGYLAYGEHVNNIITLELPRTPLTLAVKLCLCAALFLTYVLMCVPVFNVLENNWFQRQMADDSVTVGPVTSRVWLRGGVVAATALVAIVIPNFGHVTALVGATGCNALAFVLPPFFHMCILHQMNLSHIQLSAPTRLLLISYAVFCLKKKKRKKRKTRKKKEIQNKK